MLFISDLEDVSGGKDLKHWVKTFSIDLVNILWKLFVLTKAFIDVYRRKIINKRKLVSVEKRLLIFD